MLQRIQTIYMLIALLIHVVLAIYFHSINDSNNLTFSKDSVFYLMYLILAVDVLISIFLFKKRTLQLTFNRWMIYAHVFLGGSLFYLFYQEHVSQYWILCLPVFAIVFLLLANRAIQKDEELVRSVDRIR